ncbi:hypothetical protein L2U69_04165 [Zavarzinia compransoris]|uniref:alginate O-acetyltransferase AlgX-related protein n=1 Tax=Zavarzinia marina TaxID=2911065 RepID=UPI001F3AACE0|nr:hypothetical protein [Zavarzinia marina]MCF4164833.1 hypothetical protein [Zavarzinia marina]
MEHDGNRLAGVVLAAVLIFGLVSSVLTLGSEQGRALLTSFTLAEVADGTATDRLAKTLNDDLLGGDVLAETAHAIDWVALGDLGTQVRLGCDGYLFLREEFDVQPGGAAAIARRAAMAGEVSRLLAAQGIHLTVVVTPDKSRMMTGELCGLRRSAASAGRIDGFFAALAGHGVDGFDLRPAIAAIDRPYYKTDTHWNEAGAGAAAKAIADHLATAHLAPEAGPPVPVVTGEPRERVGDLIRLAGLDGVAAPFRPDGDMVAESEITLPVVEADDLLGDMVGPPVAVIGSSYSRNGNFIGFLAAALSAPIADMARDGGAFAGAAMPYFDNPAFIETPPQVIVWEIPERVLDSAITPDEEAWAADLSAGRL